MLRDGFGSNNTMVSINCIGCGKLNEVIENEERYRDE